MRKKKDSCIEKILLIVVIIWFLIYLFLPSWLNLHEIATALLHAFMNVFMTILVLIFAFTDRYKAYRKHRGLISKFRGQFVSFALALVPFASAMSDLNSVVGTGSLILPLIIFTLGLLYTIETSLICDHQNKEDFMQYFLCHIVISITLFATFLILSSQRNFSGLIRTINLINDILPT